MASRQLVEQVFQQLSLDQDRNTYISPHNLNINVTLQNVNSTRHGLQFRQQEEIRAAKKTRRKPRHNRNKDNIQDDESSSRSRHSLSSNNSITGSPFRPRLVPTHSKSIRITEPTASSSITTTANFPNAYVLKDSLNFSIKAINNKKSKFIRKRNCEQKFINLKSFAATSCLFLSNPKESQTPKESNELKRDKVKSHKYSKNESRRVRKKREQETEKFNEYINANDVTKGLSDGTLVKGCIRINPKNFHESYVNNEDSSIADYCIMSVSDRNRALEGDEVILQIKSENELTADNTTAKVVYITQKVHSRRSVGVLKPHDKDNTFILFVPRDKRFPIMRISQLYWPIGFKEQPKSFENVLFLAQLLQWNVPNHAQGVIVEKLGQSANLLAESLSILRENDLDVTPFSEELKECLPEFKVIPQKEFEYREDLRKKCIFTIDPATARDLDDAVSVEILSNGNFEVGVHISDAAFYLKEGTALDQAICKKATTIYLVENAYHMFPIELCLACSLLPGEDKLSFSVLWEMTQNGDIVTTRFTRSIINSCAKLAYEHAQMIIEDPNKEFTTQDFPQIFNEFEPKDLASTVNILQSIATKLRETRLRNGALRINNTKLLFALDPTTSEPLEYFVQEYKEANSLIEEFMLMANISVAKKIYEDFPDLAFLRCHEPPKNTMLAVLRNKLALYGIHLNTSSSGAIATSLQKYCSNDYPGRSRAVALNHLTSKTMTRAQYYCANTKDTELDFKHYALNVPIYTHFTSPIRRYADIMVHRLLAASLKYTDQPEWDVEYVEAVAKNCNKQKYQAKKAGDASAELYLAHYIEQHAPFNQECVVVDVKENKIDVVALKTGSVVRIYSNSCEKGTTWTYNSNKLIIIFPERINLKATIITVELFSLVTVHLQRKDSYHLEGSLVRPAFSKEFTRQKKQQKESDT